jgi:ferredoxin
MPKKYHIHTKAAPPRFYPVGKYGTIEFRENCAGSCKECVKKKCVYNIFKDNYLHMSQMEEPEYLYTCNSCFRCIQECTKGIFSRVVNPEYREIGDDYWTPDLLNRTWYQAHTGSIPVSGAGYRGRFVGKGFDSMWTDMSEIVRPTRDGIHGREYINTSIELTRRPERLAFNEDGSLAIDVKPILEIPLPILFQQPQFGVVSKGVLISMIEAAKTIGTKIFIRASEVYEDLMEYGSVLIPMVTKDDFLSYPKLLNRAEMVEIKYEPGVEKVLNELKSMNPKMAVSAGVQLSAGLNVPKICTDLAHCNIDTLHLYADKDGRQTDAQDPRFIKDMLRDIHLALIADATRQQINIIATGGIGLAEHVNKAIICGADGVSIDLPLLIAMECRLCHRCDQGLSCPVALETIDPEYGKARIINLMGAWRNQMLELLGAMGLREVRRLRGEVGRSMWFEDLEKESFAPLFGERKVAIDSI